MLTRLSFSVPRFGVFQVALTITNSMGRLVFTGIRSSDCLQVKWRGLLGDRFLADSLGNVQDAAQGALWSRAMAFEETNMSHVVHQGQWVPFIAP